MFVTARVVQVSDGDCTVHPLTVLVDPGHLVHPREHEANWLYPIDVVGREVRKGEGIDDGVVQICNLCGLWYGHEFAKSIAVAAKDGHEVKVLPRLESIAHDAEDRQEAR